MPTLKHIKVIKNKQYTYEQEIQHSKSNERFIQFSNSHNDYDLCIPRMEQTRSLHNFQFLRFFGSSRWAGSNDILRG